MQADSLETSFSTKGSSAGPHRSDSPPRGTLGAPDKERQRRAARDDEYVPRAPASTDSGSRKWTAGPERSRNAQVVRSIPPGAPFLTGRDADPRDPLDAVLRWDSRTTLLLGWSCAADLAVEIGVHWGGVNISGAEGVWRPRDGIAPALGWGCDSASEPIGELERPRTVTRFPE